MALQLIVEAALNSSFQSLLKDLDLIFHCKDFLIFCNIDTQQVKTLQKEISGVQDVLSDGERRSYEQRVSNWMDDVRDLLYDVEDMVDEMNIQRTYMEEKTADKNRADKGHQVVNYKYTFWDDIASYTTQNNAIKKKISIVMDRVVNVVEEANKLGLEPVGRIPLSNALVKVRESSGPLVDESEVYGREDDKDHIIEMLIRSGNSSKKNYSVMTIVGMGGMGKTALAQLVFKDQRIKECFELRSWACVSDVFDANRVVRELLDYFTEGNFYNMTTVNLLRRLEDKVRDQKILVVLDDVWTVKAFDTLKPILTHCAEGSKILVTSRDIKVGNAISTIESYELKTLGNKHCWTLFKEKAFGEVVDRNLENIGRAIVKKCKGVPLAVKVVGSSLRFASKERWESTVRNDLWQSLDTGDDEIFPALKLSYHYLPSTLKRCFGYLSLFPTDYSIDKHELVRLWIAEGLVIESRDGRILEDIGNDYYNELQRRCLIQKDNKIHDLLHSLACLITRRFSCHVVNDTKSCMDIGRVRHLSFVGDLACLDQLLKEAKCLRTLLHFGHVNTSKLEEKILNWKFLRVLDLKGSTTSLELPSFVANLKHLRYLCLSRCKGMQNLPDSLCELHRLQTLDLCYCKRVSNLPNDLGKLGNLRYLCLSDTSVIDLPSSIDKLSNLITLDLSSCSCLIYVPENVGGLQALRKLYLCATSIFSLPHSVCKLSNLQQLDLRNCRRLTCLPEDIGCIQNLQTLHLSFACALSTLPNSLGRISSLTTLSLKSCSRLTALPENIGELQSLRNLDLSHTRISALPSSLCKLSNLSTLSLKACSLLTCIPEKVGNLQNLQELDLFNTNISFLPESICKLNRLQLLDLDDCYELCHLPSNVGDLQNLRKIHLQRTPMLGLPDSICRLKKLQVLDLGCCEYLSKLPNEIGDLQDLRKLNLSHTPITCLPGSIRKFANLQELDVRGCTRLTLSRDDIENLRKLKNIIVRKYCLKRV